MLTVVKRDGQLTGAVVRYHGHEVVALTCGPGGDEIVFNTHGYRTQSTFRVMEWFCELCSIPLFFKREKWQWLMKRTLTQPHPARMHWLVKQQDPLQIIHNFGGSDDDKGQGQRGPGDVTDSDLFVYSLVNPPEPLSQQRGGKRLKTA
jgi:hypothetical protein